LAELPSLLAPLCLADGDAVDVHRLVSATFSLLSVQCRNRIVASSNLARPTKKMHGDLSK